MSVSLTRTQQEVVDHVDGALLVVAGPGAGKTRVVTERIRRLLCEVVGHFRVLALTFTNKAANEMKERLDDSAEVAERAFIGTMHSFCLEVLENRGKAIGMVGDVNILETFEARKDMLAAAVRSDPELVQLLVREGGKREQAAALARWLDMISECKAQLQTSDLIEDPERQRIMASYDAAMRASSSVDFDDLLLMTYRIFEENPKVAAFYRRQYRFIFVDEAQDINEAQYRLLCALCGDQHRNVMLVGDPKQAIYVWNGADPRYLDLFRRDFGATVITLHENFRSSQAVVRAAQVLNPAYVVESQAIEGRLVAQACADEESEALFVCDEIERLVGSGDEFVEGPITLDRVAVLGRNRYVLSELEREVGRRSWPHHKKLASGAFRSESELFQVFELALRVLVNPHSRIHIGRLASLWGIAEDANALRARMSENPDSGEDLLGEMSKLSSHGTCAAVQDAVDELNVGADPIGFARSVSVLTKAAEEFDDDDRALAEQDAAAWLRHWSQFIRSRSGTGLELRPFLSQIALGGTEQARGDGLALLTVHSAKGMEFDVVFVMGLCQGVFPDYRARGAALEEEDRSAFVAVTRAKRLLYLTYPKLKVMPWGDTRAQSASKYFAALTS